MRTQATVNQIIAQAKIVLSQKYQLIALQQQSGNISELYLDKQYEEFFAIENILYALQFQTYLTLFQQNILCDYLVRKGYFYNYDSLHFTEDIFNDQTFDTIN